MTKELTENAEADKKYHFSFRTDYSFDPICAGPQVNPAKPECVPIFDLGPVPQYESSQESSDKKDSASQELLSIEDEESELKSTRLDAQMEDLYENGDLRVEQLFEQAQ